MAKRTSTITDKAPDAPPACAACKGTGSVSRPVQVGRRRRLVGQQDGICLTCLGTGTATADES